MFQVHIYIYIYMSSCFVDLSMHPNLLPLQTLFPLNSADTALVKYITVDEGFESCLSHF